MTNAPFGYHISKGALGIFYILNDGDRFVKKLSTSLKEAKSKAKDIVGRDVPVDVWYRYPYSSNRSFISSNKEIFLDQHILDHYSHIRKVKKEKKIAEAKAKYSFVGYVGDILDLELTITEIFWFDGDYGVCCVHKFKDADDNSLIYFGNSKQFISEYDSKFKVGDKITVTATIKRHTKSEKDVAWTDGFDSVLKPVTVISKPKLIKEKTNA